MNTEVEDIKARLSVREVIGGYVTLTKAGVSWKGLCPFHNEKSPSFVVNEERASWHCFGCSKGGDIFSFIMEMDGLSFPEALSLLAERAGVVLERRGRRLGYQQSDDRASHGEIGASDEGHSSGVAKETILKILNLSSKFFEKQLLDGAGKKAALPYLQNRGLSDESIRAFRLGFALPGWQTLSDFLISKGYSASEMEAAGMVIRKQSHIENKNQEFSNTQRVSADFVRSDDVLEFASDQIPTSAGMTERGCYDRFRNRITFPILDTLGRVVGFSARVAPSGDESQAKYINTPETMVYHKSRALYGIFQAKQSLREKNSALLVEGNMDVIAMHQAGCTNTIAVSGTALTEEQLRIIKRYADTIRLFFDMDSAGQKAARKSAEMALALGFSVAIVSLSSGKDAAEMAKENIDALYEAVSKPKPAPEYFLETLLSTHDVKSAEGKRRIAEDFLALVRLIPQHIEEMHWVHILANRTGVDEKTLLALLKTLKPPVTPLVSRDAGNPESSVASVSFETQSEKLGRDIAAILLACPKLLPLPLEGVAERVFSFVAKMPFLAFLAGETAEEFSFAKLPEEFKKEAAELAFLGEKMLRLHEQSEETDIEKTRVFFDATWKHLIETLRREEMESLERAMRAAHERGDVAEERHLVGELVRVGREE